MVRPLLPTCRLISHGGVHVPTRDAGRAWYVATRLAPDATAELAARLADEAGVRREPGARQGVEVIRRGQYVFVLNRTGTGASVPVTGTDLLTGAATDGVATVGAGGAAVIRTDVGPGT